MRRLTATLIAIAALTLSSGSASADSGNYSTDDGPDCSWFGSNGMYNIDCSGYSRRAGGHVSFSCDLQIFGSSSSWSCRDRQGNTWRGSR